MKLEAINQLTALIGMEIIIMNTTELQPEFSDWKQREAKKKKKRLRERKVLGELWGTLIMEGDMSKDQRPDSNPAESQSGQGPCFHS